MAGSGDQPEPPPDVGFKDVPPSREGLEALAALAGMTNARLKELDSNLVDGGTNIKASKFNPEAFLKGYVDDARAGNPQHDHDRVLAAGPAQGASQPAPAPPPPPAAGPPPPPSTPPPTQASHQGHVEMYSMQPRAEAPDSPQLNKKLDLILAKLDILENSYSMVIGLLEKNLKNKIKTVTFKLDDQSKDTK